MAVYCGRRFRFCCTRFRLRTTPAVAYLKIGEQPGENNSISITLGLRKLSGSMIRQSIRRQIVAIAVALIVLMVATSILSMVIVVKVGQGGEELTARYIPANALLTRINVLSVERALAVRRMVIAKMQEPPDEIGYKSRRQLYLAKDVEIDAAVQAVRKHINAIIEDTTTPSDNAALARIDSRIDDLMSESRRRLKEESAELFSALDERNFAAMRRSLGRSDVLRDELDEKIDVLRTEMVKISYRAIARIRSEQNDALIISAIVTLLAAV